MKFKAVARTLAATAVAVLIAGCGGGGSSGQANLQVGGTAATGAALANASVQVKCAAGSGTATTNSNGGYTVTVADGALPCLVKVTGTAPSGAEVTLHSVTEAGTSSGGTTTAVANVTPITEMIVAQLTAALPSASFDAFNPALITAATVASASSAVVTALQAAGVDLGSIDPLKSALVPPSGSTAGNAYDDALEKLGETVTPEALPMLVTQIAAAAATSNSSSSPSAGLTDAMAAVSGGSLANCPVALSGKYRTIEYTGGTAVHTLDFKANTFTTQGGGTETIVPSTQACEFSMGDAKIVIGPSGAGAFVSPGMTGYIFPVQSHTLAAVTGTWNFMESGLNETNAGEHFMGKFTFNADGSASVCEYDVMSTIENFTTCNPETDETVTVKAAADGSFDLLYGSDATKVYGYLSPNGALNLFGTSNPENNTSPTAFRTHFVMTRPAAIQLQELNTVNKGWDVQLRLVSGALVGDPLTADSVTVTAVDTSASTSQTTRASDGRVSNFNVNYPVEGVRYRPASSGIVSIYQMPMTGLGLTPLIDNAPSHLYVIGVARP
jgi:hypothetical protein